MDCSERLNSTAVQERARQLCAQAEQLHVQAAAACGRASYLATLRNALAACAVGNVAAGYALLQDGLLAAEVAATAGELGAQTRASNFARALARYVEEWGTGGEDAPR